MNDNYIVLRDNRKLGYEDYGDKGDTAIIIFYGTPGSRIGGLEDSPLMKILMFDSSPLNAPDTAFQIHWQTAKFMIGHRI